MDLSSVRGGGVGRFVAVESDGGATQGLSGGGGGGGDDEREKGDPTPSDLAPVITTGATVGDERSGASVH